MKSTTDKIMDAERSVRSRVTCTVCGSQISVTRDGLTRVHRKAGKVDQCDGSQRRVRP